MYFEMLDIFIFSLICCIILYWVNAQKIREFALLSAKNECEKLNLQLLDGSVSLKKMSFIRLDSGNLSLKREYSFEFSATGDERYQGLIKMNGRNMADVHFPPHRIV